MFSRIIAYKNTKIFAKFAELLKRILYYGQQLGLDISKEVAQGSYSNLAIITHSHSEFILDFARMLPGFPKAEIFSRVIMTPEHAKRLLNALQDNVVKYESSFGIIDLDNQPKGGTINFGDFGALKGGPNNN